MSKEIEIPYNFKPRWYQLEYLQSAKRFKIAVFHRRAGKSAMALNAQIMKALTRKGVYYYFLPTYRQAKSVIWDEMVGKHVPRELVSKINESELAIYWKNGSIQRFAGCDDIDKHRGINPIDVVFDEFSEMDPDIWQAVISPVLRQNGGTASFIFTPKGKNHSWVLLNKAKANPEEWFISVKTWMDTDVFTHKDIETEKRNSTEALFKQEYECNFEDNAGAFFRRVRENLWDAAGFPVNPRHSYEIGVDLAKYNDFTVIAPVDLNTFRVQELDRFNQVDWNLQRARVQVASLRYNNARVKIDRSGSGDAVVEDLQRSGLNMGEDDAILFTAKMKNDLLMNLAIKLERGLIKLPNDSGLVAELESMQFVRNQKGMLKFETANKELHDDRVMAVALAVWGIGDLPLGDNTNQTSLVAGGVDKSEQFDRFSCF